MRIEVSLGTDQYVLCTVSYKLKSRVSVRETIVTRDFSFQMKSQ